MNGPNIARQDLETWANFLLDHSLGGIAPSDVVMVKGEPITWPLMSVLQDKIFAAGAIADIHMVAPDNDRGRVWGAAIARHGTLEQIARTPEWHRLRYESMTKYLEILGASRPDLFAHLPEAHQQAIVRADNPFWSIRMRKRWALTLYPTQAFADLEGMSLDEYTRLIVAAATTDPRALAAVEEKLHQALGRTRIIRIVSRCPARNRDLELSVGIEGRAIVMCTGLRNFPDGEVFTSPNARDVQGEIFVDLPIWAGGTVIQGIYLRFEDGVVREYSALQGEAELRRIIETDAGSRRLGEVAFGMNSGLTRALKHVLLLEKVGGTLHIALGESAPECYGIDPGTPEGQARLEELAAAGTYNKSARHVDIVLDCRPGGAGQAVYLDDLPLRVRDNLWEVQERSSSS